jgi:hypothetical protein
VGERQGDNDAGREADRVTIAQAAALLGCHPNTVRNRVRAGIYEAEKVVTERGPTWMIDPDSLTTNTPTSASQQLVSGVPALQQEALQALARAIVREAGLGRDPEKEAAEKSQKSRQEFIEGGREHWKSQVDFFKHMTVISGASIVGVTALREAVATDPNCVWCVSASAGSFLLAALVSVLCLFWASAALADFSWGTVPAREEAKRVLTSSFMLPRAITYLLFAAGLVLLWGGLEYFPWP